MNLLIDNTVRITVIMLIGLGARFVLRRRSAAVRHWVLAVSILCAASAPMLGAVVPVWDLGMFFAPPAAVAAPEPESAVITTETFSTVPAAQGQALSQLRASGARGLDAGTAGMWLGLAWVVGVAISLLLLQAISELIKRIAVMRGVIPDPYETTGGTHAAIEAEAERVISSIHPKQ